jgi:hypothetical protein
LPPATGSPNTASIARKARLDQAEKSKVQPQPVAIPSIEEDNEEEDQEDTKQGLGRRAWWWKYYNITTLTTTWEKGRGKRPNYMGEILL